MKINKLGAWRNGGVAHLWRWRAAWREKRAKKKNSSISDSVCGRRRRHVKPMT